MRNSVTAACFFSLRASASAALSRHLPRRSSPAYPVTLTDSKSGKTSLANASKLAAGQLYLVAGNGTVGFRQNHFRGGI